MRKDNLLVVVLAGLFATFAFLVTSCGKPDIRPTAVQPSAPTSGVPCPVHEIPGSSTLYDGAMCKYADESAQGIESLDPVKVRCHRLQAEKCQ